jgi:hypothetical protein
MAVCNSRPRENPPFIIPGINCGDQNIKRNCRKFADLSTDALELLMQKIESVYNSKSVLLYNSIGGLTENFLPLYCPLPLKQSHGNNGYKCCIKLMVSQRGSLYNFVWVVKPMIICIV